MLEFSTYNSGYFRCSLRASISDKCVARTGVVALDLVKIGHVTGLESGLGRLDSIGTTLLVLQ